MRLCDGGAAACDRPEVPGKKIISWPFLSGTSFWTGLHSESTGLEGIPQNAWYKGLSDTGNGDYGGHCRIGDGR